ncbi:hypothetical protein P153DRAFT_388206 [Dothidotthia symphoricarpi CBS 119687]|uniref:Uncharacterized protein n=1 Tax=Dothidotthia symphoricarpi CBS 119687 TaxID=1392245 RepID=A0A6A6A5R3_9PLEO|nr:uncharacterized protein P153DRAFT_388206 [Dothidotthia symphoricarpi CBS 119687]KAF2126886.1 hypothetical protein P153DRAFT_388206 [Dothidotthia symphoricarpi CBS 119687]
MTGQNGLHRSSWKVEAIRRGDMKISGPMPIEEDTRLNGEGEMELAGRRELDLHSQPQDVPAQQNQRSQSPLQSSQPPTKVSKDSILRDPEHAEGQLPQRENVRMQQLPISPLRMHQVNATPYESIVQSTPPTTPTPFRGTPESMTKAAQKKNRKSGLRNVFRKILGRKDREKVEEQQEGNVHRGHNYHSSDPGLLRQSPPRDIQTPSGPRISELPVDELIPLHPIGLQLPFPMNVNAPQASSPQEYLIFGHQKPGIVRRATLPNARASTSQRHSVDEPRGRLSPWDEGQNESSALPEIGIALTSPVQARTSIQSKRRSRSAGALHDLSQARTSIDRSRSADIRYWRESGASASTFNSHARPQTAKTTEMVRSVHTQEPIVQQQEPVAEMSATLAHFDEQEEQEAQETQEEQHEQNHWNKEAPVSAFNFGEFQRGPFADEKPLEVQEPPIPVRSEKRLSIEDRVKHLEGGLHVLESSMRRMSTRNNRQTIVLENAPRHTRSRNRSSSRSISVSSFYEQPIIHQAGDDDMNHAPFLSTTTPASEVKDSKELVAVYETLAHERAARSALEIQVRTLQHDVADLRILVNRLYTSKAMVEPAYTTSSPNSSHDERLSTPRAMRHKALVRVDVRESVQSRFSRTDSESTTGEYDRRSFSSGHDDVVSPDVWATPSEGTFFHSAMPTPRVAA